MLNQLLAGVLLLLLPLLPLSGLAQDRNIAHDGFRFLNRDEPQLLEYPNLGIRLPSEIYGKVFVKAIGESRNSNLVRILVE